MSDEEDLTERLVVAMARAMIVTEKRWRIPLTGITFGFNRLTAKTPDQPPLKIVQIRVSWWAK